MEKSEGKLRLSNIFLILAILAIIVMGIYIYTYATKESQKTVILQDQIDDLTSSITNLQKAINNMSNTITDNSKDDVSVSYIVVLVEDTSALGLAYKSKKITDKKKISELMNIVDTSTNYELKSSIPDFGDISPCVELYTSNGEKYTISAADKINDNGNTVNLMTKWTKEDASDKTLFKVDIKLAEFIENLYYAN